MFAPPSTTFSVQKSGKIGFRKFVTCYLFLPNLLEFGEIAHDNLIQFEYMCKI